MTDPAEELEAGMGDLEEDEDEDDSEVDSDEDDT